MPASTNVELHRRSDYPIPQAIKAWLLGNPEEASIVDEPVLEPGPAEVLARIDAVKIYADSDPKESETSK